VARAEGLKVESQKLKVRPEYNWVAGHFESKDTLSVPRQAAGGTERPLQNHVAFVAATCFSGGLLILFTNDFDPLPGMRLGAGPGFRLLTFDF
jgi:hypothetical protein